MWQRTYELYAKGDGPYEMVPTGWSFLAAFLGPIWAMHNGVLWRYAVWMSSIVPALFLAVAAPPITTLLFVIYFVGVFLIYVPRQAFGWRATVLRGQGYELRASIVARSSREALRTYALSFR